MSKLLSKKKGLRVSQASLLTVAAAVTATMANRACAQTLYYNDGSASGLTSGDSWDSTNWTPASASSSAGTLSWIQGDFARFYSGVSGSTYTITVGQTEQMSGMYNDGPAVGGGTTLIFAQSGTGNLYVTVNTPAAPWQGFIMQHSLSNVEIDCPITGPGGVEQQGAGYLALYGNNTFSGGFFSTGGQITYFNNTNSFGTGTITDQDGGNEAFYNTATNALVIPNAWQFGTTNTASTVQNMVSTIAGTLSTPSTTYSGSGVLQTGGTTSFYTGFSNNVTAFSGSISGNASGMVFQTVQTLPGTIYLSGSNTCVLSNGITITGGTLAVKSDYSMGDPGNVIYLQGGTGFGAVLLANGTFTTERTIFISSTGAGDANTVDVTTGNTMTIGTSGSVLSNAGGNLIMGTSGGTLEIGDTGDYTNGNTITVNGGTLAMGAATNGGLLSPLNLSGQVTVNAGKFAILSSGATSYGFTNSIANLAINGAGQFDLANSSLLTSTTNSVRQYLINGYHGGAWNGTGGITSASAHAANAATNNLMALGYSTGTGAVATALGLSAGQTLVKYTLDGDANLDGKVDINDLNIVLSNYLSGNPGTWDTGDFKYTGETDINDLNIVLSNYLATPATGLRAGNAKAIAGMAAAAVHTLTGTASPDVTPPVPASGQMELVVNTVTGDVELYGNNADIASLQTTSAGSIISANWMNMHSHGYSNWQNTKRPDPTQLSEYDAGFSGSGDYAAVTGMIDYGDVFNINDPQDLVFQYGQVQSNDITVLTITGSVYYTAGVPEPTSLSLLGLAAAGLMGRRRARRRN